MYGLYDKNGILRFINSDQEACLEYIELFELDSTNFILENLNDSIKISNEINLDLNQVANNN